MSALCVENPMIESMVQKTGRASLLACLVLALGACASLSPVNQEVALRVTEGGERVEARWSAMKSVTRSTIPMIW